MFFTRLLTLVLVAAGLAACGARPAPTAAPAAADPPPAPEVLAHFKDDFLTLENGRLPEAVRTRVEIRNYAFAPNDPLGIPEVSLEVFNVDATAPLTFEIRTLFFREDGTLVDATEWARAEAAPRRAYRYRAASRSSFAASELVQLRLVDTGG